MHNNPIVGCGGTTYGGNLVKDRYGVYMVYSSGEMKKINVGDPASFIVDDRTNWAADKTQLYYIHRLSRQFDDEIKIFALQLNPQKVYQEDIQLDDRKVVTLYRDGYAIYSFDSYNKSIAEVKSFEDLLDVDAQTFEIYAALWRGVVFRDKTGLYFASVTNGSNNQNNQNLMMVMSRDAKLVCLEAKYLCLLSDDTLYYVFDDGTVKQTQISNPNDLQCFKNTKLLPSFLDVTASDGMCFDRHYFYAIGVCEDGYSMYFGGYEKALSYAISSEELKQKRIESLKRVNVKKEPLLIKESDRGGERRILEERTIYKSYLLN